MIVSDRIKYQNQAPLSMSANNRRIRRVIVDILWDYGPMTKQQVADILQDHRGIRQVPSPQSLSALLSKNPQVICLGIERVETAGGGKARHMKFGIDRNLIRHKDDIMLTRPVNAMTPTQRREAVKCLGCGRTRVMPEGGPPCLHCRRYITPP